MTTAAYASVGARLVERGYAAIPVMPGTKRPGQKKGGEWFGMFDWRERFSTRLPSDFEVQHWSSTDAGVCVVAGPASGHLVAIDIDTEQPDIDAAIRSVLPKTTVRKTGAKGETLFYRCPNIEPFNGTPSPSFNVGKMRVCDIIGPGRQTVLPPTQHPDTRQPYQWTGPDALEDTDPADLPELPPDICSRIARALERFGYEIPRPPINGAVANDGAATPHRLLNDTALQRLDAWVPQLGLYRFQKTALGYKAVATWRPSSTGRRDQDRKQNLSITSKGIRDFGDDSIKYTALNLVIASQACDLDTAFKFLAEAVGWFDDIIELTPSPSPTVPAEAIAETPPRKSKAPAEPFADLTHVPGVVGDLVDWITATARRPNRVLALGAAVTVVGTLIGRRVAGPTRSATHLYAVTLAKSGAGKNHALDCIPRLMEAASAIHHLGPSEFMSMSAVINALQRQPLALCPQDEFGAYLARILNAKRASSFEAAISKILRTVWGVSFNAMPMPEWAGREALKPINSPALSICGASTPEDFYEAMQGSQVKNGFLNRFLIIGSSENVESVTPSISIDDVPVSLQEKLQDLYNWDGAQLGTAMLNNPNLKACPEIIGWTSPAAARVHEEHAKAIEKEINSNVIAGPFIARTAEIALRLATIRAAGCKFRGATVDASDMEWGRAVADASAKIMMEGAGAHMADNEHQAAYKRVLRIIDEAGTITRAALTRRLDGVLNAREKDSILSEAVESGRIDEVRSASGVKGGRPSITYISASEQGTCP